MRTSVALPLLVLTLGLPPVAGAAEVYRCVDKGVTTYQDFPCKTPDGGTVVRLPEQPPPRPNSQEDLEALRNRVDAGFRERRQREIVQEITRLDQTLARLDREEAAELDVLRQKRGFAANNFQADGWDRQRVDRALVEEMGAVSAKYRERSEPARRRILELQKEQKALTTAAK